MNALVIINGVDITPCIDWASYKISSKELYESWRDGNYVEHRVYTRTIHTGSFEVFLCGMNNMDTDSFMDLIASATNNNITTMAIFDNVSNSMQAIEAYLDITPTAHNELINGNYFDKFTIGVTER
jgi:hypothetical protein